jgi:hypothetical protein
MVPTPSEMQGEKSSLLEQQADCQHLAQQNGLRVVSVYRDKVSCSFVFKANSPAWKSRGVGMIVYEI